MQNNESNFIGVFEFWNKNNLEHVTEIRLILGRFKPSQNIPKYTSTYYTTAYPHCPHVTVNVLSFPIFPYFACFNASPEAPDTPPNPPCHCLPPLKLQNVWSISPRSQQDWANGRRVPRMIMGSMGLDFSGILRGVWWASMEFDGTLWSSIGSPR